MMQVRGTAKHIILPRIITLQNSKPSKTLPRAGLSLCRPDRQDPISISIIITPPMETMGRRIWAPADKNRQPIMLHAHNPSVSPVCPAPAPRHTAGRETVYFGSPAPLTSPLRPSYANVTLKLERILFTYIAPYTLLVTVEKCYNVAICQLCSHPTVHNSH